MNSLSQGAFRLFQVAGITVYLHWSWFLVAIIEINFRGDRYPSAVWNIAEYLTLFGIVLMHEFGHALACRQVGGKAERIVLWPLGGVAFVNPPPRPGAQLWSIAAGPLVNVALVPVTFGLCWLAPHVCPPQFLDPFTLFCEVVRAINVLLLGFNLLPIYPLDGGQMVYALLWFVVGRARALMMASVLGMLGAGGLMLLALLYLQSVWMIVLSAFLGFQAINGWRVARTLAWMQPALDHFNRAMASVRRGAGADAVAECDMALALIPPGHRLRENVNACRAVALAQRGGTPAALCPSCGAVLKPPDVSGTQACGNCGWRSAT